VSGQGGGAGGAAGKGTQQMKLLGGWGQQHILQEFTRYIEL